MCMKLWFPELLIGPIRHQPILDGSKSTIFQYFVKHSLIYLLVSVLSLGSVRLCIMYVGKIAGQKLTEGYVTLY